MMSMDGGTGSSVSADKNERDGLNYDSFLIRIWHVPKGRQMHRVELQHLQTGLVEADVDPAHDWIATTIGLLLGHEIGESPLIE
jgi:hypothetical protein